MVRLKDLIRPHSWSMWDGFDLRADFCVWLLQRDGLRAAPFDLHPDGTGELRALGMTAERWQQWFDAVVQREESRESWGRWFEGIADARDPAASLDNDGGDFFPLRVNLDSRPEPDLDGAVLRRKLAELWDAYGPLSNARRTVEPGPQIYSAVNLYRSLRPYHSRIPQPFVVRLVRYVGPVNLPLPPSHLVLGLAEEPSPRTYQALITLGAAALSSAASTPAIIPPREVSR